MQFVTRFAIFEKLRKSLQNREFWDFSRFFEGIDRHQGVTIGHAPMLEPLGEHRRNRHEQNDDTNHGP